MPIVARTGQVRSSAGSRGGTSGHNSSQRNRSHSSTHRVTNKSSTAYGGNNSKTAFMPAGTVHPPSYPFPSDPIQPVSSSSVVHRPVRHTEESKSKPFVPAGSAVRPTAAAWDSHALEVAVSPQRRIIRRHGSPTTTAQQQQPPFFPAGVHGLSTSTSSPGRLINHTDLFRDQARLAQLDHEAQARQQQQQQQQGFTMSTEYTDRYKQWELPAPPTSPPRAGPSSSSLHLSAAHWQSENREAYQSHPDHLKRSLQERLIANPSLTTAATATAEGGNWKDDFDRRRASLRARQESLLQEKEAKHALAVAEGGGGKKKKKDNTKPPPPPPPPAVVVEEDNGNERVDQLEQYKMNSQSEYKTKYIEWPLLEQHQQGHHQSGMSRVLPLNSVEDSEYDAYTLHRQRSEYKQNYTNKHLDMTAKVSGKPSNQQEEAVKPMVFAWPEPPPPPPPPAPPAATTQSQYVQDGESEYKKKYQWPLSEREYATLTTTTAPPPPPPSFNLFEEQEPHNNSSPHHYFKVTSEYQSQYIDKAASSSPLRYRPRKEDVPVQFAWPLPQRDDSEGNRGSDGRGSGRERQRVVTTDDSEYHSRYQWPPANLQMTKPILPRPLITKQQQDGSHGNHGNGNGDDVVLVRDNNTTEEVYQSEYQAEYQSLRDQMRRHLNEMNGNANGNASSLPAAGVPTASRSAIPTFYAWTSSSTTPPPPPAAVHTIHVPPEHYRTEYGDKYLEWEGARPATLAVPTASSTLNEKESNDRLNLFSDDSTSSTRLKSEYKERFQGLVGGGGGVVIAKGPHDESPPQFAWSLTTPPPPPPTTTRPSTRRSVPLEKTEYDAKFIWPSGGGGGGDPPPPPPAAGKPSDRENYSNQAPIIGMEEYDKTAKNWKTEYDASHGPPPPPPPATTTTTLPATTAVDPAAGLVVLRNEDIPAFFAWAEQEANKPPPPPPPPIKPRNGDLPITEYEAQYQPKPLSTTTNTTTRRSHRVEGTMGEDHVKALHLLDDGDHRTPLTEYEASYHDVFKASKPMVDQLKANKRVGGGGGEERPLQFAWSVDTLPPPPPPPPPTTNRVSVPFEGQSEYDSHFTTPSVVVPTNQQKAKETMTMTRYKTNPLGLLEGDGVVQGEGTSSATWQSEYDDRFAILRKRQEVAAKECYEKDHDVGVAGVVTPSAAHPPSFFAWNALEPAEAVVPSRKLSSNQRPTEISEYADKFATTSSSSSSLPVTSVNHAQARLSRSNTFASFEFGGKRRSLDGQSEYDSQFNPYNSTKPPPATTTTTTTTTKNIASQVGQEMRHQTTLSTTNLDPRYTDTAVEDMNKAMAMTSSLPSKKKKEEQVIHQPIPLDECTEQQERYQWPIQRGPPAQPTLTPHRSQVMIGNHMPRSCYGDLPNKENIAMAVNQLDQQQPLPLTEAQSQFRWPGQDKPVGTVIVSNNNNNNKAIERKGTVKGKGKKLTVMTRKGVPAKYVDRPRVLPDRRYLFKKSPGFDLRHADASPTRYVYDHKGNTASQEVKSFINMSPSSSKKKQEMMRKGTINTDTMMSRDSLVPPTSTTAAAIGSSTGSYSSGSDGFNGDDPATTTGTVLSSKSHRSTMNESYSNESYPSVSSCPAGMTATNVNSLTVHPPRPAGIERDDRMLIPGLRSPPNEIDMSRSRSAPPRRLLSSSPPAVMKLYGDEQRYNPVLLNRRYPSVSDKQSTRWATETMDSFRWRPRTVASHGRRAPSP